jgi:hypothetical protein
MILSAELVTRCPRGRYSSQWRTTYSISPPNAEIVSKVHKVHNAIAY